MNTYRLPALIIAMLLFSALFVGLQKVPAATPDNTYASTENNLAAASASTSNMKYVVFRDDDIAPSSHLDTLKAINQVHADENVPVTLGVIPHPDPGTGNELLSDQSFLDYMKSIVTDPLFEIAQHGYTHLDSTQTTGGASTSRQFGAAPYADLLAGAGLASEFRGRPYADQFAAIKQGRDDLTQAFGVTPTTFIPPWNSGDDNTLKATHALGFTLYSTGQTDFNVNEASLQGIMVQAVSLYLGYDTATQPVTSWDTNAAWNTGMSNLTKQTDISLNSAPGGASVVILYHYWMFCKADGSPDPARIALLKQYIEHLKGRGDVLFSTLGGQQLLKPTPDPAVCSQDGNNLDVFAQGAYHALWHKHYQAGSGWSGWEYLGGSLTSSPAASSSGSGTTDVFVRGGDNALWHKHYQAGSGWSGWEYLGGYLTSAPTATSPTPGTTDVFVRGGDNALWEKTYNGAWSGWTKLGGSLTSSPAASSLGSGTTDVFVRGGDNALWEKTYNGAWSGWTKLGGSLTSSPAASSLGSGTTDVFVRGGDNGLWHKSWGGSWSGWEKLGGSLTSSPAATSPTPGTTDVFVRGGDNALWEKTYNGAWSGWTSLGRM